MNWLQLLPAYLALGAVAGVLAGLLGIGGGLIIVAALVWLLPLSGVPPEHAVHAALATALASIVFTATASARAHHRRGSVIWGSVRWLAPGMLVGGALGARLATWLPGDVLRWLVAGYCALAGLQMLLGGRRRDSQASDARPRSPWLLGAGGIIGAVAAVVGIGGGSLTVPLLIRLGATPVRAVGTSSACGVIIALSSAAAYVAFGPRGALPAGGFGYVYLPAALGIATASVLAAPWGTRLAHAISGPSLARIFAIFLLLVALVLALGR